MDNDRSTSITYTECFAPEPLDSLTVVAREVNHVSPCHQTIVVEKSFETSTCVTCGTANHARPYRVTDKPIRCVYSLRNISCFIHCGSQAHHSIFEHSRILNAFKHRLSTPRLPRFAQHLKHHIANRISHYYLHNELISSYKRFFSDLPTQIPIPRTHNTTKNTIPHKYTHAHHLTQHWLIALAHKHFSYPLTQLNSKSCYLTSSTPIETCHHVELVQE